jgi:hypothetical protein
VDTLGVPNWIVESTKLEATRLKPVPRFKWICQGCQIAHLHSAYQVYQIGWWIVVGIPIWTTTERNRKQINTPAWAMRVLTLKEVRDSTSSHFHCDRSLPQSSQCPSRSFFFVLSNVAILENAQSSASLASHSSLRQCPLDTLLSEVCGMQKWPLFHPTALNA